jgi:hypothetical protein
VIVLALLAACSGRPFDPDRGIVDFSELPPGTFPEGGGLGVVAPIAFEPVQGFHDSRLVELYDLGLFDPDPGTTSARVHPMYVFVDADGAPLHDVVVDPNRAASHLVGQAPIVDVLPQHDGYSPLFEVVRVHLDDAARGLDSLRQTRSPLESCRLVEGSARCRPDDPDLDPHASADCGGDPCFLGFCRSGCASDDVCGEGQSCESVHFAEGPRAGSDASLCMEALCQRPEDCADGFDCVSGLCRSLASHDCDLEAGERCLGGHCRAACDSNDDCGLGRRCHEGFCEDYECDVDFQCTRGQTCLDGICRAPVGAGEYRLGDVKSETTIREAGWDLERTGEVVLCPIVDLATTIDPGLAARDRLTPRVPLWYRGMRTACLLLDGGEALVAGGAAALSVDAESVPAGDALLVGHSVGDEFVPGDDAPWILERRPGDDGYSPFVRAERVEVPSDYEFGGLDSADAVDAALVAPFDPERFHVLAFRGEIPACAENADCDDTGIAEDPPGCSDLPGDEAPACAHSRLRPLTCNPDREPVVPRDPALPGFCDLPPVGIGAPCDGAFGRCDPEGGVTGSGLVCLFVFEESFCYDGCNHDDPDDDPDPERDSRCASADGYRCFGLTTDEQPNGVCIRLCETAGDEIQSCESPSCGNGTLEMGEACDFDPAGGETDTCNDTCSIDTSAQDPAPEAPVDDHPLQCQFGFCIYPDARVDQ